MGRRGEVFSNCILDAIEMLLKKQTFLPSGVYSHLKSAALSAGNPIFTSKMIENILAQGSTMGS